jgi:hypothetical protein
MVVQHCDTGRTLGTQTAFHTRYVGIALNPGHATVRYLNLDGASHRTHEAQAVYVFLHGLPPILDQTQIGFASATTRHSRPYRKSSRRSSQPNVSHPLMVTDWRNVFHAVPDHVSNNHTRSKSFLRLNGRFSPQNIILNLLQIAIFLRCRTYLALAAAGFRNTNSAIKNLRGNNFYSIPLTYC